MTTPTLPRLDQTAEEIMAEEFLNPAPPPIPVRDRYFLAECGNCNWVGSSEQLGGSGCDDDIWCPVCCDTLLDGGTDCTAAAKHGQTVYQRIVAAEDDASRLRTENEILRDEVRAFQAHSHEPTSNWEEPGRFDQHSTASLAAQCRMQARANMDPELRAFMFAVADRLKNPLPAPGNLSGIQADLVAARDQMAQRSLTHAGYAQESDDCRDPKGEGDLWRQSGAVLRQSAERFEEILVKHFPSSTPEAPL